MGAVQPFISGAISKTINMPAEADVDDVAEAYMTAWKLGLKAVAIYRDGSKRTQPLNTGKSKAESASVAAAPALAAMTAAGGERALNRRKLPDERQSITHKFDIAGHEGYITVGKYEDGSPGEIFVMMSKQGSTISGLMDSFATAISYALQYGVPLRFLVDKFSHMRFEPSGFTKNPQIPYAKSIVDYLFRWLASKFLDEEARREVGVVAPEAHAAATSAIVRISSSVTNGPWRSPRPGRTTFASPISPRDRSRSGGNVLRKCRSGVMRSAARSVCWMAYVFGATSANTKNTATSRTVPTATPMGPSSRSINTPTRVAEPSCEARSTSSTELRVVTGESSISTSRCARLSPSSASARTRIRLTRVNAVSASERTVDTMNRTRMTTRMIQSAVLTPHHRDDHVGVFAPRQPSCSRRRNRSRSSRSRRCIASVSCSSAWS